MKNLLIKPNANIKKALEQLKETGEKCLVVVDHKNKLLGRVQTFSSKNKDGINELTETITGWLEM